MIIILVFEMGNKMFLSNERNTRLPSWIQVEKEIEIWIERK
jgi:hypothetical protein